MIGGAWQWMQCQMVEVVPHSAATPFALHVDFDLAAPCSYSRGPCSIYCNLPGVGMITAQRFAEADPAQEGLHDRPSASQVETIALFFDLWLMRLSPCASAAFNVAAQDEALDARDSHETVHTNQCIGHVRCVTTQDSCVVSSSELQLWSRGPCIR